MKSDGVDRRVLERLLNHQIAGPRAFSHRDQVPRG
jgi:hypothetical protein